MEDEAMVIVIAEGKLKKKGVHKIIFYSDCLNLVNLMNDDKMRGKNPKT